MYIKNQIENAFREALVKVSDEIGYIGPDISKEPVVVERPRNIGHGDFSCNIAMQLVKARSCEIKSPRDAAAKISASFQKVGANFLDHLDIAGPGFINIYLKNDVWIDEVKKIHELREKYGSLAIGLGRKVHIEYVSANPTGPLHVGHGRGAVVGDVLARLYEKAGYKVTREYYVNDLGTQISVLGASVKAYIDHLDKKVKYEPEEDWYRGEYIQDIARQIIKTKGADLSVEECGDVAAQMLLEESIKKDLAGFGVRDFDQYYSEKELHAQGAVEKAFLRLREKKLLNKSDGAVWFLSTKFGDEKDRVVVRENGQLTYLASDIAYHGEKFKKGYDEVIDIWGADHHGYIARVKGAIEALGYESSRFRVVLIQMVKLLRNGVPVKMSKRAGDYVTMKDLLDEVGADAARLTFLTRRTDSHLDFDLELVKKKSMDNPVYYLQYAYARTCNIFRFASERGLESALGVPDLTVLNNDEIRLIRLMACYEETVLSCITSHEPYYLVDFLLSLAKEFHSYYNKHRVITDDELVSLARLYLVEGLNIILKDAFNHLGIDAPEKM